MTGLITYQAEPWSKALPEMMGHWPAHWEESAVFKSEMALDPDLDRYAEMERNGKLLLVTARRAGELVGYYVWLVSTPLHHRTVLAAYTDMYWLRKDCRRGFAGVRLFKESERHLKALGVTAIFSTTRAWSDIGRIFERLGWMKSETVYCKYIGSE